MLVFTTHYCYYIHELLSIVQPIYVVFFSLWRWFRVPQQFFLLKLVELFFH